MASWLRDRKERRQRDLDEARYLIKLHGERTRDELEAEISASEPGGRRHKHWLRIGKVVRKMQAW